MNSSVNKAFVCIICLVMFVFITAFSGDSLLESPKTLGVTFPHTLAGFGCWTKVDEAYQDLINIEKAGEILDQLEEVGDNYLYGWINFQGKITTKVYLYIDTEGNIVSFLHKDTPPAGIIDWNYVDFENESIEHFTITKVLESMFLNLNIPIAGFFNNINFCDFQNQLATKYLVAITYAPEKKERLHIAVPSDFSVYSWSYRYYTQRINSSYRNVLYLDSNQLASTYYEQDFCVWLWKSGNSSDSFNPLKPHSFILDAYDFLTGIPRVAVIIVYGK